MKLVSIKNWIINSVRAQMYLIIFLFAIIGLLCFLIISRMENDHLKKDAETALAYAEVEFSANLLEPETFLTGYAENIRSMIISGGDEDTVFTYMNELANFMVNDSDSLSGLITTHGYFFNWDKYMPGTNLTPPDGFISAESQWYAEALKAQGETVLTGFYRDLITENYIITLSCLIKDDDDNPLAIICLDIGIDRFSKHSVINITKNSFAVLVNAELNVIAHKNRNVTGMGLYQLTDDLAFLYSDLLLGYTIFHRSVRTSSTGYSIVYFRKLKYDWHIGIIIPVFEYFGNLMLAAVLLIVICSLFSWGLCVLLKNIYNAKIISEKRTQQKSNFLATMSHEIRTPLNAILGMTEIQMQGSSHPPATIEAFLKINNSGKLLLNIINDILDLSKIESGRLELLPEKYDVASLINDIIQLNYIRYEYKPVDFKIEIDENIPSILVGDELRIKQIFNNLLSNAFKFTDSGEIVFSVSAECIGRGGGAVIVTLIFQIKDTGHGMTQEQVSKLFDENTRFDLEANRATEGAGLGMTITCNLINLMYGKINVKSTAGEGTTVNVRLPQKTDGIGIRGVIGKELAENLRQYKVTNAITSRSRFQYEYMPYGRILIVDDVETNLYVAKGLMVPYGLKIDLVSSGYDAIKKVKDGIIYDIIFMDHMMPKMDGIEATGQIRDMGYTSPIVALTANAITGQAEMFLKNGFDDFISKPIDIRLLNNLLNRLIRDKQPKEIIEAAHKEKALLDKKGGIGINQALDSQLAEIFARDAEKAVKAIEASLQSNLDNENDIHMYVINIHAMKSALANIGENELSALALKLEHAGREKDIDTIISDSNHFLSSLKRVVSEIKTKFNTNDAADDTVESLIFLHEKLTVIKDACAAFDKKTAKNAMNELREKTWSQKSKELLNSISEHLLHSEFEEASAEIDHFNENYS